MKHNASKTRKTWTRVLPAAAFAVTFTVTVGRQPFSPANGVAKAYADSVEMKVGETHREKELMGSNCKNRVVVFCF